MRRQFSAILILSVFLSLQFGKMATFLYCKWEATVVLNKTDCGCDDHLAGAFKHADTNDHNSSKMMVNEKINEFPPQAFASVEEITFVSCKNSFNESDSPLLNSFIAPPFHPPAV